MEINIMNQRSDLYRIVQSVINLDPANMNKMAQGLPKMTAGAIKLNSTSMVASKYISEGPVYDIAAYIGGLLKSLIVGIFEFFILGPVKLLGSLFEGFMGSVATVFEGLVTAAKTTITVTARTVIKTVWAFVAAVVKGLFEIPAKMINNLVDLVFGVTQEELKRAPLLIKIKTVVTRFVIKTKDTVKAYFRFSSENWIKPTISLFIFSYVIINLVRILYKYYKTWTSRGKKSNVEPKQAVQPQAQIINEDDVVFKVSSTISDIGRFDDTILELSVGDYLSRLRAKIMSPLVEIKNNISSMYSSMNTNMGKFSIFMTVLGIAGLICAFYLVFINTSGKGKNV